MSQNYLYFILCLISPILIQAQSDNKWSELQKVLTQLAKDDLFHGTVLIAENDEIAFHQSFGKHPGNEEPIQADTPMDIASISKPLTAGGIMILASKGKINLDAPAKKYLSTFPFPDITIRHLLNQTSGMGRFLPQLLQNWNTQEYINNNDILNIIQQYPPDRSRPGEAFQYNDANYTVLGSVIEQVSGTSYTDFMKKKVFRPYKMGNTLHRTNLPYSPPPSNPDNFMSFETGSSNIFSTAKDLYQFTRQLYEGKNLAPAIIKKAFNPFRLRNGEEGRYGFGWFLETKPVLLISHRGEGHKISSGIQYEPGSGKMIIVIHPYSNIYFNKVYSLIENITNNKEYTLPQKRNIVNLKKETLQKYVGQYESQFGLLHITLEDGKLYLRPDPIPGKEELIPSSATTFYFGEQDLEWEFFIDDKGKVIGLGMKGDQAGMGQRK